MESQQRVLNNEKPRTVKAGAISFRLAHGPIWLSGTIRTDDIRLRHTGTDQVNPLDLRLIPTFRASLGCLRSAHKRLAPLYRPGSLACVITCRQASAVRRPESPCTDRYRCPEEHSRPDYSHDPILEIHSTISPPGQMTRATPLALHRRKHPAHGSVDTATVPPCRRTGSE